MVKLLVVPELVVGLQRGKANLLLSLEALSAVNRVARDEGKSHAENHASNQFLVHEINPL